MEHVIPRCLKNNLKLKNGTEFQVTFENLTREIRKRKGWTAPGIDGIQNDWWKKFESTQKALTRVFTKLTDNNHMIPIWWPAGRTILLPKTKEGYSLTFWPKII